MSWAGGKNVTNTSIAERDITDEELAQVKAGFDEYAVEQGNPVEESERFGFVAMDGQTFVGCSSGLAYKKKAGYANWFYITDLFVKRPYRRQGVGAELLRRLEERVVSLGIGNIWTWTAGYEGLGFYRNQEYEVFFEMDDWYSSGP